MIAFMLLVIANVCFGIYAVFFMKNKQRDRVRTEQNRTELTQSLSTAAAAALPTPTLGINEIAMNAPNSEQTALSDKVFAAAIQSGGSAAKGLTNENGILIFAEIPTKRLTEFCDALKKLGATIPAPATEPGSGEKTILQVRIASGQ